MPNDGSRRALLWVSILAIFIAIIGGLYALDKRWALASDVVALSVRLDQKILQDRANWIQERKYALEDRFYEKKMPRSVKEEYRQLRDEYNLILRRLDRR